MKKKMPTFWGCTITHNYPFIMESTRKALDRIGIEAYDVEGFGCCPDPVYVRACGEEMSLLLSARNLSLAEKEGKELLTACNGCYMVLSEAAKKLAEPKTREKTNKELPGDGKYHGGVKTVHLLSLLHSKLPLIKTCVKKPLKGLRVAAHYGCHILYPPAVGSDTADDPTSMEDVIEALGAENVSYDTRLDCCGTPTAAFDKEEADSLLKKKLTELHTKADCIVTTCPACFMRFDLPPQDLKTYSIPVFHISELLCLAFGTPPKQLYLDCHGTSVGPALKKLDNREDEMKLIKENFDYESLASHCGACSKECEAAKATEGRFNPLKVVDELLAGNYHKALKDERIWMCLQCGKCEDRCPQGTGLRELFAKLRELSMEEDAPKLMRDKLTMISETGYGMPARSGVRKKMGLSAAPQPDPDEMKEIIGKHRRKR